jgi:hypothetical protein
VKEVDLDMLTVLLGFTPPDYENMMSVCMDADHNARVI